MANHARSPGKTGALRRDPRRYVPVLEDYLRPWEGPVARRHPEAWALATTPAPLGDIDRETRVGDWPVYGNDTLGDCTIAAAGHFFGAMRVYAGAAEPLFADSEIISAYSAVSGYVPGDPSTDTGADPATVLKYLHDTGMTDTGGQDHRVAGYAAFRHPRNVQLMAQVLDVFGTVYVAIDCPQSALAQFTAGQPWDYVPGSPPAGGHMIVLQRRRIGGPGVLEVITWGAVQRMTRAFAWHQVCDAFAVVSQDWLAANGTSVQGLSLAQLLADMAGVE